MNIPSTIFACALGVAAIAAANDVTSNNTILSAKNNAAKTEIHALSEKSDILPTQIDEIRTGPVITDGEEMSEWEKRRKAFLECPHCMATQPFPEE